MWCFILNRNLLPVDRFCLFVGKLQDDWTYQTTSLSEHDQNDLIPRFSSCLLADLFVSTCFEDIFLLEGMPS